MLAITHTMQKKSILTLQYDADVDSVFQKKLVDGGVAYINPRYKERSFGNKEAG